MTDRVRDVEVGVLGEGRRRADLVVVERPLTVLLEGPDGVRHLVATTMRTPGGDHRLALGLLHGLGHLSSIDEVVDVRACDDLDEVAGSREAAGDRVLVVLDHAVDVARRLGAATSACGACDRTDLLDEIRLMTRDRDGKGATPDAVIDAQVLLSLPERLRSDQAVFAGTGGLHAVAVADHDGGLVDLAEDVGRHNAADKVIGGRLRARDLPLDDRILVLSGRASYELLAKAARAGVGTVAAIGAPSDLAVDVAEAAGITLIGFLRRDRGNVYSHPGRVRPGRRLEVVA